MKTYVDWMMMREADLPPQIRYKKIMIFMRGLPGSGKSTATKAALSKYGGTGGHVFSVDHEFAPEARKRRLAGENVSDEDYDAEYQGNFDLERRPVHIRGQLEKVKKAVDQGISPIIVDNTNIKTEFMRAAADYGEKNGYEIKMKYPTSPWWQAYSPYLRTKENKEKLGEFATELHSRQKHRVPLDVIQKMISDWDDRPTLADILGREPTPKKK